MLGWRLVDAYSPLLGAMAGFATGLGLMGWGLILLGKRFGLPEPWRGATAYLLGILSASLLFELAGMAAIASKPVLTGLWAVLFLPGGWCGVRWLRQQTFPASWVIAALLLLHLVVAIAPVSHQDELAYHTLPPSRLVSEGALRFHAAPWEAAVWPQLGWHVLQAPLFAMGVPQASGVLSWWTTALMIWFVCKLIPDARLASLCGAALLAQGFSISQCTAMGPHAFGYFATVAAALAVALSPPGIAWILPVAAAAMVSGKLTMAPAAALLCAFGLRRSAWRGLAACAIFVGPVSIWMYTTWKPSAEALATFQAMRRLSLEPETFLPLYEAANWSALLWLGCGAFFLWSKRTAGWWAVTLVFVLQYALVWFAVAKQLRFLGGLQYALCVAGFLALGHRYSKWLWALAVPWAGVVVWMTLGFIPVNGPRAFLERYTGLFTDYEALDTILPAGAVILEGRGQTDFRQMAWLSKPPAFYSPRPMLFQAADVDGAAPVYMLYVAGAGAFDPWLPDGYRIGEVVYRNPRARFYPNRTPGGGADLEAIAVYRLIRLR